MWKMHEIREIINLFEESSLQELEMESEQDGTKISLKKQGGNVPVAFSNPVSTNEKAIKPAAPVLPVEKPASAEVKPKQAKPSKSVDLSDPALTKITSPMVGTFYQAPEEGAAPFVQVGDKVEKSTVLCIVEAMKLFNEIEAEVEGEIVDILVENGQLVEHGQPLFLVRVAQ